MLETNIKEIITNSINNLFSDGIPVYICYQAETYASILGVAATEEKAKEICSQHGDRYTSMIVNKDYGRAQISTDESAIYNIGGVFIQGYTAANKANEDLIRALRD